ncbi:SpoIID/LytB domain-containing protein [Bacteroidota bacterium]
MVNSTSSAQESILVGLLERNKIEALMFSPTSGTYVLVNAKKDTIYRLQSDDVISIAKKNGRLIIQGVYGFLDTTNAISFVGSGANPAFKLKINENTFTYSDDLILSVKNGGIRLINQVNIEAYVAKVVRCEVGYGAELEYYKIQSIISRTYAFKNLRRHQAEGFDLCDEEHCQVYRGDVKITKPIYEATVSTSGLVMVDTSNQLILSAFHANCGGQTCNSQNVWREKRSYLTSVLDTFCVGERSALWEKAIEKKELINQLHFKPDALNHTDFTFSQDERKFMFCIGKDSIPLNEMRILLRLRSTFFDVSCDGNNFIFKGKGYGHGVGLCQQGAMKMTTHGYNYSQILGYYYKGVGLVPYDTIQHPDSVTPVLSPQKQRR